ncbi:MAG: hypothetical protein IJ842_04455 [Bacilli bacterium]|nr:hypothetical protein [Bacilli bacterium]
MKKLFTTIIVLLLTVTVNVYAEDYNIIVDENNNFTLKDSSNNQVTDNSIAKYENNTLTLGENKTFNEIKVKHDLTITSNDKEVSIKTLTTKEGNTFLPVNVNIDKLKVTDSETYTFKINIGGNYTVNNSEINMHAEHVVNGYTAYSNTNLNSSYSVETKGSNDNNYGIVITNSNINITGSCQIYSPNGGIYIEESSVTVNNLYSYGELYIDNSEIISKYVTKQLQDDKRIIMKNSKIIASTQISIWSKSDDQLVTIDNCEIESGEIFVPNAGIIITNSKIKSTSDLYSNKSITIKNSNLELKSGIAKRNSNDYGMLTIEDSEILGNIEVGYRDGNHDELKVVIKNSNITSEHYEIFNGKMNLINSTLNFKGPVTARGNATIENCTGEIKGFFGKELNIKESKLYFYNYKDNYPSTTIEGDLIINNSNVVFENKTNNYPILLLGDLILDDKIVPIDNEKTVLKARKMTQEEKENYTFPYGFPTDSEKPINIFAYEDDAFSDYVKLATTKTISFRVKNGTWLDGTKDDIKLNYFYGEKIEVYSLPEEVKKLLTSKMGEWSVDLNNIDPTKDQEIEFRYNIINPETTKNYIIMILAILAVTILLKRQISIRKGLVN